MLSKARHRFFKPELTVALDTALAGPSKKCTSPSPWCGIRPFHGELAPHLFDGCHFKREFAPFGGDLGQCKHEKGPSGLINRHKVSRNSSGRRFAAGAFPPL